MITHHRDTATPSVTHTITKNRSEQLETAQKISKGVLECLIAIDTLGLMDWTYLGHTRPQIGIWENLKDLSQLIQSTIC